MNTLLGIGRVARAIALLLVFSAVAAPLDAQRRGGRGGRGEGPPDTTGAGGAPALRALVEQASRDSDMRVAVQRFNADRQQVVARYDVPLSPVRIARERALYQGWTTRLAALDPATLNPAGRAQYDSLRTQLQSELARLAEQEKQVTEMAPLLPFVRPLQQLQEARRDRLDVNGRQSAQTLENARKQVLRLTQEIKGAGQPNGPAAFRSVTPAIAGRAVAYLQEGLRQPLESWYSYYFGFDPLFSWWSRVPYEELRQALDTYVAAIQKEWGVVTTTTTP